MFHDKCSSKLEFLEIDDGFFNEYLYFNCIKDIAFTISKTHFSGFSLNGDIFIENIMFRVCR